MKKLLSFFSISGLVCMIAFSTSCTKDYLVYPAPIDPTDTISYSADMQPFFDAKCTGCHGATNPNLESPGSYDNLHNGGYIDLANPSNSSLYKAINVGGSMESYATPAQRDMTLLWIEQGALNN